MRVIDIDTHVGPSMELLFEHADAGVRDRWGEFGPYVNSQDAMGGTRSTLRVNPIHYTRRLGSVVDGAEAGTGPGSRGALDNKTVARGKGKPGAGVQYDDAAGRLREMDEEGVDVHLIIPGTWALSSTALDPVLGQGLYAAYHRYAAAYCEADLDRLKSLVLVPGASPQWAAEQIRAHQQERWAAGIMVLLPEGLPVDDPSLDPIWDATNDADLPIVYHSFFYEPPYFPGYRDIWGNLAVARTAAHPWGAQRILAYLLVSGMFDRWPNLRIGFSETGAGWLPYWLLRLDMMVQYLPGEVPITKHLPSEYAGHGHVYCGIQLYEGPKLAKAVTDILGDGVLMYQSDYPHGECEWPNSVAHAREWQPTLGEPAMTKLLGGNAEQFLRLI